VFTTKEYWLYTALGSVEKYCFIEDVDCSSGDVHYKMPQEGNQKAVVK